MAINNQDNNLYPNGSGWRKWDMHIHTPGTKLNDGYKVDSINDVWDEFCDKIEQSDVKVFGITDYFSADGYHNFIKKFQDKYPNSKKRFFLNIELKLNESVNKILEEVNIHLIFNPSSLDKINKFLSNLKVVKTGKDETPINCSDLKTRVDYQSATVTREAIKKAFKETFGEKAIRQDHFLVFTAANNEGIRPERGKKRKEIISDEIDKFSDVIFGGTQNIEYFLKVDRLEDKEQVIGKKPVVAGSDAHSFEDLKIFLGNRVVETGENDKEIIVKDVTWIKADPTFEGLKQILYEPEPGERVWIGPTKPDKKNPYQVIKKIKFSNTYDFPEEIEFNSNLCSIIGSRSSGKSALLAYIAHAINKDLTEQLIKGPGEGEEYHWEKIKIKHLVEWGNGKDSDGKVVYIPQNYLFEKSRNSDEIKKKIEPVLFESLPQFKVEYEKTERDINLCNKEIKEKVDSWLSLSDEVISIDKGLKSLGDKNIIEKTKEETETKISNLREKYKLSESDINILKKISIEISTHKAKIGQIEEELYKIANINEDNKYFSELKWSLTPSLSNLPDALQKVLVKYLKENKDAFLKKLNEQVIEYKQKIEEEKKNVESKINKIETNNQELIKKYKKNIELGEFIKKLNEYTTNLSKIRTLEKSKKENQLEKEKLEKLIKYQIDKRKNLLEKLKTNLDDIATQNSIEGIKFNLEYQMDREDISRVASKVNLKEKKDFVKNYELDINGIRTNPSRFLDQIYSGKQKVNTGNDKKEVAQEVLTLTEKMLFVAEMEGDKIGGFSETTMTAGKRALFLLRIILAESDDKWPLLIDQPEDNLDSRSICDKIVPFLKAKEKERQIIMVSHNANLVIGADSEQIIVANRHGSDRKNVDGKQFNYLTGSIEYTKEKDKDCEDTLKAQGIREHACEILDGGKEAFEHRRNKYNLVKI